MTRMCQSPILDMQPSECFLLLPPHSTFFVLREREVLAIMYAHKNYS